jgi:uncharacterized membrane-anchored protein
MAFGVHIRQIFACAAIFILCCPWARPALSDSGQTLGQQLSALHWVRGPKTVAALQNAGLALPSDYVFLDTSDVPAFMRLMQNPPSEAAEQVFGPKDLHWFAVISYSADGYVQDKEKLDSAAILDSIKSGTEAGNEERRKNGWPEMHVTGWRSPPDYDAETKRLEWAFDAKTSTGEDVTNFQTRILGRSGVTKVVLVTDPVQFTADVAAFKKALTGYAFNQGDRYSEFKPGDKVAAYGLTALIVGGAAAVAAKTGVLKFLFKFAWVGVIAVLAAIRGFFKRLFGARRQV